MTKTNILIVDDVPDNLKVLGGFLSKSGYNCEFAINGPNALSWLEKQAFDLILLDVRMPEMDGFEVCRRIRALKNGKQDVPIMFLTAKNDEKSILKGFDAGGMDYITKPFNSKELIKRVQTHLNLKQAHDQLVKMNESLEILVDKRTEELSRSNQKLQRAHQELSQLDVAKSEFINIISSEIRTPLNGISNAMGLLRIRNIGALDNRLFTILEESVKKLETFAKKTLYIAEIKLKGRDLLKIKTCNLKEILFKVINSLMELFREKGIRLDYIGLDEKAVVIDCDMDLMAKCLEEVLSNAYQYSSLNGIITVHVVQNKEMLTISIIDDGEGFSDQVLDHLFTPFQPDKALVNPNPRLGLYLTNLIVEAHSGRMQAQNTLDRGACVRIELPLNQN